MATASPAPSPLTPSLSTVDDDAKSAASFLVSDLLRNFPNLSIREDLNRFTRLIVSVALLLVCISSFYNGLPYFLLPIGWAVYGTALFGLFTIGTACSDDSLTSSKLINRIIGTIALLPLLTPFEGLKLRRQSLSKALSSSRASAASAVDHAVQKLGSLSYGWYFSSFVDWIGSFIAFTREQWHFLLINHLLLVSFVAVFFPVMIYYFGFWGLCKFYLIPWLVYHFWSSTSIRIRMSMQLEIRLLKERAQLYKNILKRIETVPENAVAEVSQWISSIREISNSININSWRTYWFEVLEWAFGSDVFCPPVEICSVLEDQRAETPLATPAKHINPDDVTADKHKDDIHVPAPSSSSAVSQPSILSRINWVTAVWLTVTPLLTLYGLITCEWHLKTFALAFVCYQLGGIGITAGYHRLFSHRSYDAATFPKIVLTILGTSTFEGSVFDWCNDHRAHHRYTDTDKDPYNVNRGFWWAHMGWMLFKADPNVYVYSDISDLHQHWWLRMQHKYYAPFAMLTGLVIPTCIAGFCWGDWMGGFFIAAVGRTFFLQQCTFFINSLAHYWGDATYSDQRSPRDSYFVSLLTFGEGYHCFHHEFPYDYRNGIRLIHYDPGKWVIAFLELVGLAWNLKRFPTDVINKGKLQMKQKKLNQEKSRIAWGPSVAELPAITKQDVANRVAEGASLIIIDGVVHDVTDFIGSHPGGASLIKGYLGKDASHAFNGQSYNHSLAARNILKTLRMAKIEDKKTL